MTKLKAVMLASATSLAAGLIAAPASAAPARPQGPCDLYNAAGTPCVTAHSTTRALLSGYGGPLYQVERQSDGRTLDIGMFTATSRNGERGGGSSSPSATRINRSVRSTTIGNRSGSRQRRFALSQPNRAFGGTRPDTPVDMIRARSRRSREAGPFCCNAGRSARRSRSVARSAAGS